MRNDLPTSSKDSSNGDQLIAWIENHPFFASIPEYVYKVIIIWVRLAENIHKDDYRRNGDPYITHLVAVAVSFVREKYKDAHPLDIIVPVFHDAIEDHPECWHDILQKFGVSIFRDILLLSNISASYREQILQYFISTYDSNDKDAHIVSNILEILSPVQPLGKLENRLQSTKDIDEEVANRFRIAYWLYDVGITQKAKNQIDARDEYTSMGNYLFFEPRHCQIKLQDMLHNMLDMKEMEIKKPGYSEKRLVKAYLLGVALRKHGMWHEYNQLDHAFWMTWLQMYSDIDAINVITQWEWVKKIA